MNMQSESDHQGLQTTTPRRGADLVPLLMAAAIGYGANLALPLLPAVTISCILLISGK